jgi:CheY-like chemotaxis protein
MLANERIAALRQIAEDAQKAKAAFVAKVSHELRTPLNMITGLVSLIVETPEIYAMALSPEMKEDLKVVHRNCEYLSALINDVLDLSQVEAGRLTLYRERVGLKAILDSALEVVRPLVEKKALGLQVTVPSDLPPVYCDQTRIQQVILNLVSNAARFTEKGGIAVRVSKQDAHVVVSVSDTGPGIPPKDAERIFEPFCQGVSELWRDKAGSGLGLSISKQFIELHGGRIWLESEVGIGTTFKFQLPISPPLDHVARPSRWVTEDWTRIERAFRSDRTGLSDQSFKPRLVLCDDAGVLYHAFLRCSDEVDLVNASDLAQAARELALCPAHALVLNAASFERLWPLMERARLEVLDTPIIGCSIPPQAERALQAGATDYLVKPVTRVELREAIRALGKPVRRVLVVDDDPDVVRLFTRMLRALDGTIEVATASSGRQALDELRRLSPDLVLLDLAMPDGDGWEVLASKDREAEIKDVPVVIVSARDPTDHPLSTDLLLATMGKGLSINDLLRCSLEISALLLRPDAAPDPVPV